MTHSPTQEIFQLCRTTAIKVIGASSTFDYLPGKDTPYPFIFVGEQYNFDTANKTAVHANVTQYIHFYHNDWKKRGTLSNLINQFIAEIRKKTHTSHYYVNIVSLNTRMLTDNTTATPLMHGVIDIEFKLY